MTSKTREKIDYLGAKYSRAIINGNTRTVSITRNILTRYCEEMGVSVMPKQLNPNFNHVRNL